MIAILEVLMNKRKYKEYPAIQIPKNITAGTAKKIAGAILGNLKQSGFSRSNIERDRMNTKGALDTAFNDPKKLKTQATSHKTAGV